jgi:hypothetical protein
MVDESLIAYLKNTVTDWGMDEKGIGRKTSSAHFF